MKSTTWRSTISLLLFAAALYSPYLLRTIRLDEAVTLRLYTNDPGVALFDWSMPNNHKLYSLIVWAARTLWPDLLALRLPAFFFTLLNGALIYRLAGRWWGRQAGLISAALLLTNPFIANYAVEGRGYSLSVLLMLLLLLNERRLFWIGGALVLTIPTNILILIAKPRRAALGGAVLASIFYLSALLSGQAQANLNAFGPSPVELWREASIALHGTGAILCLVFIVWVWFALWRSQPHSSFFSGFSWVNRSTRAIMNFCWSRRAWALVICCVLVTLGTLPIMLGQSTEADEVMQTLRPLLRANDGIVAGCCVNDPLRFYFPQAFDRVNPARVFVVPSMYGIVYLSGCVAITTEVYRCMRKVEHETGRKSPAL